MSISAAPRVSVLMTVYNAAPFLRQSVESLFAQSFADWELIAIENGSTDGSRQILESYRDRRIKVFNLPKNIGRTPALRYAFDRSHSEFLAVLDADDIAMPERLAREVAFLDQHRDVVLVGSWAEHIDETGKVVAQWRPSAEAQELYDALAWMNPIVHSSVMYRREAAVAAGGYPDQFVFAQDLAMFLHLTRQGKLALIPEPLCQLRILSGSVSHSAQYRPDVVKERLELLGLTAQVLSLSPRGRRLNRYALARQQIRYGAWLLRNGEALKGIRLVAGALVCTPGVLCNNRFLQLAPGQSPHRQTG